MSTVPTVKNFIENDGGDRVIDAAQIQSSPTTIQFVPRSDGEEFEIPSAAPGSVDHQPLLVVVNASESFSLKLKVDDGGEIYPEGSFVEVPPNESVVLLATQRGLTGTDWSLVTPAHFGHLTVPGQLILPSALPDANLTISRTDGTGRAHVYWNTSGGTNPTFSRSGEDAMRLTFQQSTLTFAVADGDGKASGDPIVWQRELKVYGGKLKVRDRELVAEIDDLKARVTALEVAG